MIYLSFILFLGYLGFLIWETRDNRRNRAKIEHVIHVNGIRGKTGTCRLIDAGLRAEGLKVFTKTTGNLPFYIGVDGIERPVQRHGPANIKEQISTMRRAARAGAQVLVLECMAVNPELQRVCEERILHSSIGVITNVRPDHALEMGGNPEEVADALAGTVPTDGMLFTADPAFAPFFEQQALAKGSTLTLCCPSEGEHDPLMENACLAAAVCEAITGRWPDPKALLAGERRDFGALAAYAFKNRTGEDFIFLNLFAVNDPVSAINALMSRLPEGAEVVYLFNNRADRPDRIELFARRFFPEVPPGSIRIVGDARGLAMRILQKHGFTDTVAFSDWKEALDTPGGAVIAGVGNIKGPGVAILRMLEEGLQ